MASRWVWTPSDTQATKALLLPVTGGDSNGPGPCRPLCGPIRGSGPNVGLRQKSVFSNAGLTKAFLKVLISEHRTPDFRGECPTAPHSQGKVLWRGGHTGFPSGTKGPPVGGWCRPTRLAGKGAAAPGRPETGSRAIRAASLRGLSPDPASGSRHSASCCLSCLGALSLRRATLSTRSEGGLLPV